MGIERQTDCCMCCRRGALQLTTTLERTAYVCGERIRMRVDVDNQTAQTCSSRIAIIQVTRTFTYIHTRIYTARGILHRQGRVG